MPVVETIVANSDYCSVKTSHAGTVLFEYSNDRDFNDLIYAGIDPTPVFYARIPGRFWETRKVQENESERLTNKKTKKLVGTMVTQMLLDIDYMPDFMHDMVEGILLHIKSVKINGIPVVYEGGYNRKPKPHPNKKLTLSKADIWLTLDDTYVTNVL